MAQTFPRGWIVRFDVTPSTLTGDTIYFAVQNNLANSRVFIARISGNAIFSGTTAATVSDFALLRKNGAISGGTALTAITLNSGKSSSDLIALKANGGITGPAVGNDKMHVLRVPSVNGAVVPIRIAFEDENQCMLEFGESMLLVAQGTVIAGTNLSGSILLYGSEAIPP